MAKTDRRNASVADIAFGATGIADPTAPTVAEIEALTRIECALIDGLETERSGSSIPIHGLCDTESAEIAGRIQNEPVGGVLWREFDGTDSYWALFDDTVDPKPTQHFVVCRAGFSGVAGAPAAGDIVDVYVVEVGQRSAALNDEEGQRFETMCPVSLYKPDGVVAA